jgi:hypothetical protein
LGDFILGHFVCICTAQHFFAEEVFYQIWQNMCRATGHDFFLAIFAFGWFFSKSIWPHCIFHISSKTTGIARSYYNGLFKTMQKLFTSEFKIGTLQNICFHKLRLLEVILH